MFRKSPESNDIQLFVDQVDSEIAAEYRRISARAKEDPGNAGDEGEENWAELLRDWLPASVHVVTKGRIMGVSGSASPQVDVVVLHGSYPRHLRTKKLYVAEGVLAAFECKTTLRRQHLPKLFANAKAISALPMRRDGSPYRELFSPIYYGLLAHDHALGTNAATIIDMAIQSGMDGASHPRELPSLVGIASNNAWSLSCNPCEAVGTTDAMSVAGGFEEQTFFSMTMFQRWHEVFATWPLNEGYPNVSRVKPTPTGEMLRSIYERLGMDDAFSESFGKHLGGSLRGGGSFVAQRPWDAAEVLSDPVREVLRTKSGAWYEPPYDVERWQEWSNHLPHYCQKRPDPPW